ncbi:hypothetical protein BaRGS_00038187, partial [Batillaria attramentaria]
ESHGSTLSATRAVPEVLFVFPRVHRVCECGWEDRVQSPARILPQRQRSYRVGDETFLYTAARVAY